MPHPGVEKVRKAKYRAEHRDEEKARAAKKLNKDEYEWAQSHGMLFPK